MARLEILNPVAKTVEYSVKPAARQMIERVVHPRLGEIPVVGTPVKFSRMRPGVRSPAPLQGQHTDEVLAEWGYSAEEIAGLRAKKVIL